MTVDRPDWTTVLCDSLEKVFADEAPRPLDPDIPTTAFRGETVSFQLAVLPPSDLGSMTQVSVTARTDGAATTTVAAVDLVPCVLPAFEGHDDGYLRDVPGLYPDVLRPIDEAGLTVLSGQWRSAWITLTVAGDAPAGPMEVDVTAIADGAEIARHRLSVDIVAAGLPPLDIVTTHWFHADGLAQYYGCDPFDEKHWQLVDVFVASAAGMGLNSVLTPVWTPPLDTAVGTTRLPTQLVGIRDAGQDRDRFDFAGLRRWAAICARHGITHLEIAHLFTQWGAAATPAIYVERDGITERRFGWDVPATDPSYRRLLEQLIPELRRVLAECWEPDRVIFHISDEPQHATIAGYTAARAVVEDLLAGCTVVDALSDFAFYETGAVPLPVVATDHAGPFLSAGVDPLWLYYCVGQHRDVANRFIAMPSSRNRVLGTQLFTTKASGFLHWGFNFYNTILSTNPVDPFRDTCAGGGFPGGDAFVVYPGHAGVPWPSIRYRVFAEAMTDHRVMQLLRDLAGRDEVLAIVDPDATLTLDSYPLDPDHYRRVRAALAHRIANLLVS